jgi:hypothetical protein
VRDDELLRRITVNPEIFGGKPIVRGRRIAVEHILGMLAAGDDFDTLLEGKQLIAKGKEQGFLTYTEVNDHLPDGIVEPEQIEDIVRMINDMGITVHETAPAEIDDLSSDSPSPTTRPPRPPPRRWPPSTASSAAPPIPVRMYMREMGTVELLTREGELRIAKRIEDGLNQVLAALSTYPRAVELLLSMFEQVEREERRLSDVISGFTDDETRSPSRCIKGAAAECQQQRPTTKTTTKKRVRRHRAGPGGGRPPRRVAARDFEEFRRAAARARPRPRRSRAAMAGLRVFMQFKLVANVFNELVEVLRGTIERIRTQERTIMGLCVDRRRCRARRSSTASRTTRPIRTGFASRSTPAHAYSARSPRWRATCAAPSAGCRTWSARTSSPSARSRRSTARCPSARPRPAAPRRRWSRPTCAW